MFGCDNPANRSASTRNRSLTPGALRTDSASSLTAASRPSSPCRARKTRPVDPWPTNATTTYGPNISTMTNPPRPDPQNPHGPALRLGTQTTPDRQTGHTLGTTPDLHDPNGRAAQAAPIATITSAHSDWSAGSRPRASSSGRTIAQ